MNAPDAFVDVFGTGRGRPKRARRRQPGARRSLAAIAGNALRQPSEPATVRALVAELREHQRWHVVAVRDEPLLRLAVASLVVGAHTAYEQRPPARSRAGRADAHARRLTLADARVLLADVVGERNGDWTRIVSTRGQQQGVQRGAALERWRRALAEDRELLADEGAPGE